MKETELIKVPKHKIGHIYISSTKLEAHEYDTLHFLSNFGFNIEVIKPTNIPRSKNPDFLINGAIWESKSPIGSGSSTIARQFHKASKQAGRLILDLRRVKLPASVAETDAKKYFKKSRSIKHMILITKDEKMLDLIK